MDIQDPCTLGDTDSSTPLLHPATLGAWWWAGVQQRQAMCTPLRAPHSVHPPLSGPAPVLGQVRSVGVSGLQVPSSQPWDADNGNLDAQQVELPIFLTKVPKFDFWDSSLLRMYLLVL